MYVAPWDISPNVTNPPDRYLQRFICSADCSIRWNSHSGMPGTSCTSVWRGSERLVAVSAVAGMLPELLALCGLSFVVWSSGVRRLLCPLRTHSKRFVWSGAPMSKDVRVQFSPKKIWYMARRRPPQGCPDWNVTPVRTTTTVFRRGFEHPRAIYRLATAPGLAG